MKTNEQKVAKGAKYRIAKRVGVANWQVKEGPGWKVVYDALELESCIGWTENNGIAPEDVTLVLGAGQWITLAEHRAFQENFDRQHGGED